MIGMFWAAGLPWRMGFARCFPMTWAMMERAAYMRHAAIGDRNGRSVRAFYRGRI